MFPASDERAFPASIHERTRHTPLASLIQTPFIRLSRRQKAMEQSDNASSYSCPHIYLTIALFIMSLFMLLWERQYLGGLCCEIFVSVEI